MYTEYSWVTELKSHIELQNVFISCTKFQEQTMKSSNDFDNLTMKVLEWMAAYLAS